MYSDTADLTVWEQRFESWLSQQEAPSDVAHDREHIKRVVTSAKALARSEDADLAVVVPAAWLHDCVSVPKDSPLRKTASKLAADAALDFLARMRYPVLHHQAIYHAIEAHSFTAVIQPRTVEAQVVQDADRLDALGAIGIARCLMLGGSMYKPLYDPSEPFVAQRQLDDTRNVIDHFFVKLLHLADSMTTAAGRMEAERRTAFMRDYLAQLQSEIDTPSGVT